MAQRGRKPKPTAVKELEGNPGKRVLNEFEPKPKKKAPTSDVSIHVRFLYDEQVFRFSYKFNGMPYKSKPIMPYKGANPLSPFVTLGDR